MESEKIKEQIRGLENQIIEIQSKISEKSKSLLDALNSEGEFQIGQKVKIYSTWQGVKSYRSEIGIFGGFEVRGIRVSEIVYKMKKDGTPSKDRFTIWNDEKIEAV